MVKINLSYQGELRCQATHAPSQTQLTTDAPVDNNGRGESFSPTDLVATGLGACMATILGIVAQRKGISLEGMNLSVEKHMSTDTPRRISRLVVSLDMPLADNHPDRELLEKSALACPVKQSLHPDIQLDFLWTWQPSA